MQAIRYEEESLGARFSASEIPSQYRDLAREWREHLEESLAETTDVLTEKFINDEPISFQEWVQAIRQGTLTQKIHPVFCGAALRNKGVQRLLDGICSFMPSPLDVRHPVGHTLVGGKEIEVMPEAQGDLTALCFKTIVDKHGDLSFLRIYEGTLQAGDQVYNSRTGKPERINHIYQMHADHRQSLDQARAGQIVAVIGLKNAVTGDTLCCRRRQISLEPLVFPPTVISMRIEPTTIGERDRLAEVLARLAKEDPTFRYESDLESGQLIVFGMGELHLEVIKHRMMREFKVDASWGRPRVAYRQTTSKKVTIHHRFDKLLGGKTMFAEVELEIIPLEGEEVLFESRLARDVLPQEFVKAVEQGVREAARSGGSFGFEVIGVQSLLVDAAMHDVDSTEQAFDVCAFQAFLDGIARADPRILEPIMRLEVATPIAHLSSILADLNSRRAQIVHLETSCEPNVIQAEVPLAELFGYATVVRSLSQGRASNSMEPKGYGLVPQEVAKRLGY